MPPLLSRSLTSYLVLVDVGFLVYWTVTALGLIPIDWAFKDYHVPQVVAWNWSFLPLDLLLSASGLSAVAAARRGRLELAYLLSVVALALTFASGFMALSYWTFARDFDLAWWAANLLLVLPPLWFLPRLFVSYQGVLQGQTARRPA